jgi:protein-disulfide isomerase
MRGRAAAATAAVTAVVAALALAAAVASPALGQVKTAQDDIDVLSRAGNARAVGPDSARVTVIEFLDYACSVCASFHVQRADSVRRALAPDVKIVYVNFPLSQHMRSFHGSEAAMCAGAVGGHAAFTAMADRLLRRQGEWTDAADPASVFARYAKEAGIDSAAFAGCRERDVVSPLILSDLGTANKFEIDGTPMFVILPRGATSAAETSRASGNISIAELTSLIAQARAKSK